MQCSYLNTNYQLIGPGNFRMVKNPVKGSLRKEFKRKFRVELRALPDVYNTINGSFIQEPLSTDLIVVEITPVVVSKVTFTSPLKNFVQPSDLGHVDVIRYLLTSLFQIEPGSKIKTP